MTSQTLPPPGEFKTTQEIRDARYAEDLSRRRRRLLWWSLPVVVLVFLVALKLVSATVINIAGISAYDNQNHNTAADRFSYLQVANVVERWKPPFNEGTATYASGDYFGAMGPLDEALELVPKEPEGQPRGELECAVRTNYSLALEGLADEALLAENPGTALDYLDQAQAMLADCAEADDAPDETQDADERQQESQEQAQEQQEQQQRDEGGEPDEPEDGGDPDAPDEDDGGDPGDQDPQQEELERRNQEAQREREEQEQREGGGDGGGQNW